MPSGALTLNSTSNFLKSIQSISMGNTIYSKWSKWSRCQKQCRQVRRRRCKVSDRCGNTILKETRSCRRNRSCNNRSRNRNKDRRGRRRKGKETAVRNVSGNIQHIVRRKRLSKKARGQMKKHKLFYSKWTRWTTCNGKCQTGRTRKCEFETMCGKRKITEKAYCYTEGSRCETWHSQGNSKQYTCNANFTDLLFDAVRNCP